jgi:hypothetical protein
MAAASHELMIKYGLAHTPSDAEVAQWAALARQLIRQANAPEIAGEIAAKQLFVDFRTRHYASQADTIEALLRAAEGK